MQNDAGQARHQERCPGDAERLTEHEGDNDADRNGVSEGFREPLQPAETAVRATLGIAIDGALIVYGLATAYGRCF